MLCGLLVAVLAALFAHTREGLFIYGFTDPRIIFITVGVVIAWYWKSGRLRPDLKRSVITYGVCQLPSLIMVKDWATALFGYRGLYSGGLLATGLCGSGVLLASALGKEQKETLRRVILASGVLLSFLCAAQYLGRDPLRWPLFGGGAPGLHGSTIDTGALLVSMFSISHNPIYLLGLWATHRRAVWSGAAVALAPIRLRVYVFILVTVVGMTYSLSSSKASDQDRTAIWTRAAAAVSWLGTGPATFAVHDVKPAIATRTAHAHNSIMDAAVTKGVFGVLGLFALLIAPQMAGLWTVCMFQPVSFEIIFLACVLVGLSKKEDCYA